MAYFESDGSPHAAYSVPQQLRPSMSRRGRWLDDPEEPRSSNPVSLEDFIVNRPIGRARASRGLARDQTAQAPSMSALQTKPDAARLSSIQRQIPGDRPSAGARRPSQLASSAAMEDRMSSIIDSIAHEFREYHHKNGELTVFRRSTNGQNFVPLGRIAQSDVSYFLRFCERSVQDNQHDAEKMKLYREHIDTMVKHMDDKRMQQVAGHNQSTIAAEFGNTSSKTSSSPEACRSGSQFTVDSELASNHAASNLFPQSSMSAIVSNAGSLDRHDRRYAPTNPASMASGFNPFQQQMRVSQHMLTAEERAHQAYEREQRTRYIQQQFAAQRDGSNLTGYEPSPSSGTLLSTRLTGDAPYEHSYFDHGVDLQRSLSPVNLDPARSVYAMPQQFQEFVPKLGPIPAASGVEPASFQQLLLHSAPFEMPDQRRLARDEDERSCPMELSSLTDDALRSAVPLVPQRQRDEAARVESSQRRAEELHHWWDGGRRAFAESEAYSTTVLGGSGRLHDEEANIGTPLMVALFKTLQGYQQSRQAQTAGDVPEPLMPFKTMFTDEAAPETVHDNFFEADQAPTSD